MLIILGNMIAQVHKMMFYSYLDPYLSYLDISSFSGELLNTLRDSQLTEHAVSIDIFGDYLIVPCWEGKKFQQYRLS